MFKRTYQRVGLAVALLLVVFAGSAVGGSFVARTEFGYRYIPSATAPSNCTSPSGRVCTWVSSADNNLYWQNSSGSNIQLTAGNITGAGAVLLNPSTAQTGVINVTGTIVSGSGYNGASAIPTFSATVAVNCTTAETQHIGTVNANVTGATMTSGGLGELCTVMWAKDATANAYTVVWSGTNVRSQGTLTMSTASSSLAFQTFRWDDRLGTAAWVEIARGTAN